jgi:hypothetical protein
LLDPSPAHALAQRVAGQFGRLPQVQAVALGGSQAARGADPDSDIDVYVYTTSGIAIETRRAIVAVLGASHADLDLQFWDPGDEWFDAATGIEVDIVYWDAGWIADQLDRVLIRCQASMGYSTCFWHTIRRSQALFDRAGWFASLQARSRQPYPEALQRAIIAKNHPVLRGVIPSYARQIEKAVKRRDLVSANHRVAALLASYFDVVFAVNKVLNPGEKRLLSAAERCARTPHDMRRQVDAVLCACAAVDESLPAAVDALLDSLDDLLRREGLALQTASARA